jgi:hypothetical protein
MGVTDGGPASTKPTDSHGRRHHPHPLAPDRLSPATDPERWLVQGPIRYGQAVLGWERLE